MLHGAVAVYSTYSHQLSRKVCIKSAFPLLANLTLLTLLNLTDRPNTSIPLQTSIRHKAFDKVIGPMTTDSISFQSWLCDQSLSTYHPKREGRLGKL